MQKINDFINKHWFVLIIIAILLRMMLSCALLSFYLRNLNFDDKLMIKELTSLEAGKYLGEYNDTTLVKGVAFPAFLYITNFFNMSYSFFLTILYIAASIFFILSLKKIVKDRKMIIIIYIFILFNPISYSSELFQRLYRSYNQPKIGLDEYYYDYDYYKNSFASKAYWHNDNINENTTLNVNNISGNGSNDAITIAQNYATSRGGSNGRLLTYDEIETYLSNPNTSDMIKGLSKERAFYTEQDYSSLESFSYWCSRIDVEIWPVQMAEDSDIRSIDIF